eukprot:gene2553-4986_t
MNVLLLLSLNLFLGSFSILSSNSINIEEIMNAIHIQQHPEKHVCLSRRLLILQFDARSFEGIGSILRIVYMGLAEAAHSNRTLVWGLDLPYLFDRTRKLWQGNHYLSNRSSRLTSSLLNINDISLNCTGWRKQGGGPYSCFFKKLSSCSLMDATYDELQNLALNGFEDRNRLKLQDAGNRGLDIRHKWAAALAAYAFRLKPNLKTIFEQKWFNLMQEADIGVSSGQIWGMHIRHGDVSALTAVYQNRIVYSFEEFFIAARDKARRLYKFQSQTCNAINGNDGNDNKNTSSSSSSCSSSCNEDNSEDENGDNSFNTDTNRNLSSPTKKHLLLPRGIFIASDNPNTSTIIHNLNIQTILNNWPDSSQRFRTNHGSHTVAADGGCILQSCALPWDILQEYTTTTTTTTTAAAASTTTATATATTDRMYEPAVPRENRIMRVLLESIEDLFYLSKTDVLITQMTSHYSTYATLLIKEVSEGSLHCAFIHSGANLSAIPAGRGAERWNRLTHKFFQGLSEDYCDANLDINFTLNEFQQQMFKQDRCSSINNTSKSNNNIVDNMKQFGSSSYTSSSTSSEDSCLEPILFNTGSDRFRLRMEDNLPMFPHSAFEIEVQGWLGTVESELPEGNNEDREGKESRESSFTIWPGECPLTKRPGQSMREYVIDLINHGSDHHRYHTNQAMRCWNKALDILLKTKKRLLKMNTEEYSSILNILEENMKTLRLEKMFPYSMGEEKMNHFYEIQFGEKIKPSHDQNSVTLESLPPILLLY